MDGAPRDNPEKPDDEHDDDLSLEDVADDAIEYFREGNDDPRPVTPPPADDEQPPPNA